jgi:hypothetical protein
MAGENLNRFSGFRAASETAEAVPRRQLRTGSPLKRGVNEMGL